MRPIRHDNAHERTVLSRNILVIKRNVAVKAKHVVVEAGPLIHSSQLYITDDMVDTQDLESLPGKLTDS